MAAALRSRVRLVSLIRMFFLFLCLVSEGHLYKLRRRSAMPELGQVPVEEGRRRAGRAAHIDARQ